MAGGNQQEGGSNSEMTGLVVVVVIFIALFALWFWARPAIVYPAFALDYVSIKAIELIKGLGPTGKQTQEYVAGVFNGNVNAKDGVTLANFYAIRDIVGSQTRWVFIPIILALAGVVLFRMKGKGYSRIFSLGGKKGQPLGLFHYQSEHWKVTKVSAYFDPDNRDKEIMPQKTPMEWMRDNKITWDDNVLDRDRAEEVFSKQLGKPWTGFDKADLQYQVVAVLVALHFERRKGIALGEREGIAIAWSAGANGTEAMKALVEKYRNDKKLRKTIDDVMSKHAWSNVGLFSFLLKARRKAGVLATSDMLWLRYVDRDLHYSLNNCGRRRYHIEGAGTVNHFFAENLLGGAIIEPHLEQAIDGLEDSMIEHGITSIDEFWEYRARMDAEKN